MLLCENSYQAAQLTLVLKKTHYDTPPPFFLKLINDQILTIVSFFFSVLVFLIQQLPLTLSASRSCCEVQETSRGLKSVSLKGFQSHLTDKSG